MAGIIAREMTILMQAVRWACYLKAQVVIEDEKESGRRLVLNFGHTIAHALESLLNYQHRLHGEAVAIGMVVAAHLSWQQGILSKSNFEIILALINSAGLPTKLLEKITVGEILAKLKYDKKHSGERLQWVLLQGIGEVELCHTVTEQQIARALINCGAQL